jgi:hypothetical protein
MILPVVENEMVFAVQYSLGGSECIQFLAPIYLDPFISIRLSDVSPV